jgi:hypothetical protein
MQRMHMGLLSFFVTVETKRLVKPTPKPKVAALLPQAATLLQAAFKYVDGNVHTNGIEKSLLKRTIGGTYVSVEPFHLFRYLDEQAFRFNRRKASDSDRFFEVLSMVIGKRLEYKQLIGQPS